MGCRKEPAAVHIARVLQKLHFFPFFNFFIIHTTYRKKKLHAFTAKRITRLDNFFVHDLHFHKTTLHRVAVLHRARVLRVLHRATVQYRGVVPNRGEVLHRARFLHRAPVLQRPRGPPLAFPRGRPETGQQLTKRHEATGGPYISWHPPHPLINEACHEPPFSPPSPQVHPLSVLGGGVVLGLQPAHAPASQCALPPPPPSRSTLTFLGMGQSPSSGSPAGMLKKKPVYLRSKDYARTSLAGLNYTWGHVNYSQPLTALWNPDYPLYPHVLYTEPVHCVLDWGGPLVTPDGEVMGLLVGYPGPTTSDGGPYVYRFQQKAYKYPQGCTDAADVFVDLTAPAVQQWLQDRISARPYLKVTGPGTERGDGVYNREIPRGGFGPYTFAFKVDVSVGFDEIRVAMNPRWGAAGALLHGQGWCVAD